MYIVDLPGIEGKTFLELSSCVDNGALLGIYNRSEGIVLSPDPKYIVANGDKVIVFAENEESVKTVDPVDISKVTSDSFRSISPKNEGKTVIIGSNEVIDLIINELPDNTEEIVL
jgi:dihydrofolate reductase